MTDKRYAAFGDPGTPDKPNNAWYAQNVIMVTLPFPCINAYTGKTVISVEFHRKGADLLKAAMIAVLEAAKAQVMAEPSYAAMRKAVKDQYGYDKDTAFYDAKCAPYLQKQALALIHACGGDVFGGSYVLRYMRGKEKEHILSGHAWASALDMDPARNPMGTRNTTFPSWYVEAFEAHGFTWGGRWAKRPDPMHFELRY